MAVSFGSSHLKNGGAWAFLQSTLNDIEADVITGVLETNEIPTMRKYPGSSSLAKVYLGSSFGVEIYVPAGQLEKARALLYQIQQENQK